MKFYKDSTTGKWILGTREGIPAGTCLYNYDSATELIVIEYASDRTIFARLPYSEFLKENGDAYASKAEFDLATADFFVKTAGGISSGIEVIDALGYEPLDKQVFEAHKPWATSSHVLSPHKVAASGASGQAIEIDLYSTLLEYSNAYYNGSNYWYNTGTISTNGINFTITGGTIDSGKANQKITINGISRIIATVASSKTGTLDYALSANVTEGTYAIYSEKFSRTSAGSSIILIYAYDHQVVYGYNTGSGTSMSTNNLSVGGKVSAVYGFQYDGNYASFYTVSGHKSFDGKREYLYNLNNRRYSIALEDDFVSYQPTAFTTAGTVSVSGTTVTGVGTSFVALLANNSKIRFSNGEERQVTGYTDATHITIDRAPVGTVSGATFGIYLTRLKDNGTNLIKTDNAGNQTTL